MGSGSGLGGCYSCIKYLMFAFNFIFWLIGCALVGVGIWVMVDDNFKDITQRPEFAFLQIGGIVLIVVGGIIMVVGFFGCCGAIRESQCCLVMFFICMLILFLVLVAAGVACIVFKDPVTTFAVSSFREAVTSYTGDQSNPADGLVDLVQTVFKCCGADSILDYKLKPTPESCKDSGLGALKGCVTVVPEKLNEHIILAAGISLGAGAVMLLGMIFSMLLCCAIRDQD